MSETALHQAIRCDSHDIVKALLLKGARVEIVNRDGMDVLCLATSLQQLDTVRLLLALSGDIGTRSRRRSLMLAIRMQREDIARVLFTHGLGMGAQFTDGVRFTPLPFCLPSLVLVYTAINFLSPLYRICRRC